ncbi:MAG: AraC family transcriptional regulator, partial [Lachnospiraceae bacterium]|nr:AraC family transcriptional regulator [Lachnospiraceae bacterium]
ERSQKDRHKKMALEVSQYSFSLLAQTAIGWEETENFFRIVSETPGEGHQTCMVRFASRRPFSPEEMQGFARKQEWLQDCGFLAAAAYSSDSRLLVVVQAPDGMDMARCYTLVWFFVVACTRLARNASASVCQVDAKNGSEAFRNSSFEEEPGNLSGNMKERIDFPPRAWRRIRKKDAEKYSNTLDRYLRDRLFDRIEKLAGRIASKYPDDPVPVLWETIQLYIETMLSLWPDVDLNQLEKCLAKPQAGSWLSEYLDLARKIPLPESEDAFASMQQWMNEAFASEVTLSSAAERMGLDTAYFSRLYKKRTGRNFSDDLTDIRMRHAENMLRDNPRCSLEELCEACGFSSKTYFSEVFKRWKGMTITQFLKTLKT